MPAVFFGWHMGVDTHPYIAADWLLRLPCLCNGAMIELMRRIGTSNLTSKFFHYLTPSTSLTSTQCRSNGILIDGRNILRPETVESLFLAYRATGDEKYRRWGWQIFEAFQKWCRVEDGGYAGIEDVQSMPPKQLDRMETFWLGETLSESSIQSKRKCI